jgi:arsenate reductase
MSFFSPVITLLSGGTMSSITVYHNPKCGTSRNALELLRNKGFEPEVIEYLKTPPDKATLTALIQKMGVPVRDMMRRKGSPYDELDLDNPTWTDDALIDLMLEQPILINRPIVVTAKGVVLARPIEKIDEILP